MFDLAILKCCAVRNLLLLALAYMSCLILGAQAGGGITKSSDICSYCARAEEFLKLPPEQRLRIWFRDMKEHTSATGLSPSDDEKLLISMGADTVAALLKIVRTGSTNERIDAVSLLCDMDRFVPLSDLPAPEPFGHAGPYLGYGYRGPLHGSSYEQYMGELDAYMFVDGRRIGREGLEAVEWAATQTNNKKLRTFARDCSGLTLKDLQPLSTTDLLDRWRKGVISGHGFWINLNNNFLPIADGLLIQRADESIPLLARIAFEDNDQAVRLHARQVLLRIDAEKVRLRGSEAGRNAIVLLIRSAQEHPLAEWAFLARRNPQLAKQAQQEFVQSIGGQTLNDTALRGDPPFAWMARAFADLYGENTTYSSKTPAGTATYVKPEFRTFIDYLTGIDPGFPAWECSNISVTGSYFEPVEQVRPCFKSRIERMHYYWRRYQNQRRP